MSPPETPKQNLSSQQDCISLALRGARALGPTGRYIHLRTLHTGRYILTYVCERGVLSEFRAARTCASYWFDKSKTNLIGDIRLIEFGFWAMLVRRLSNLLSARSLLCSNQSPSRAPRAATRGGAALQPRAQRA